MERLKPIAMFIIALVIVILLIFIAYISQSKEEIPENDSVDLETVILEDEEEERTPIQEKLDEENLVPDEALYKVTFDAVWSRRTHPDWIASGPHFSPPFVWSYAENDPVFILDGIATPGVEEMAETGNPVKLAKELSELKEQGSISSFIHADSLLRSPGKKENIFIKIKKEESVVTAATMIAPTPDWFTAVYEVELFKDGQWIDYLNIDTTNYDAGTDSGTFFSSQNIDTRPQERITLLSIPSDVPLGSFIFERIE